ncbi:MAG: type I-B CRISPR-associated protein Cas7/Csh2 [Candidatus Heimdallarchaeota archaeon]
MTGNILTNRRELVFIYDVRDSNPNGDPDDENRPRMDLDGYNIVTDVRLKRTIRDYWLRTKDGQSGCHVLIRRELKPESGNLMTMEDLITSSLGLDPEKLQDSKKKEYRKQALQDIASKLPETFIDVRCFGSAVTIKGATHSITGPVQFAIGRSLNKPQIKSYTITTTFASQEERGAGTFGEFHVVDYSLIAFHSVICEYNARITGMSENDAQLVFEGLWKGTELLNTRSKFNHSPRLLFSVVSKVSQFQIGDLDRKFQITKEENIKNANDAKINISELIKAIEENKDHIEKIELSSDNSLTFVTEEGETKDITALIKEIGVPVTILSF